MFPVINTVLFAVLKVRLAANGKVVNTYGLLDPGSEGSLIEKLLLINWNWREHCHLLNWAPSTGVTQSTKLASSTLSCPHLAWRLCIKLEHTQRRSEWRADPIRWSYLNGIQCPDVSDSEVTVLIGMNVVSEHLQIETRSPHAGQDGQHAIRTREETRRNWRNAFNSHLIHILLNSTTAQLHNILQELVHQSSQWRLKPWCQIRKRISSVSRRVLGIFIPAVLVHGQSDCLGEPQLI